MPETRYKSQFRQYCTHDRLISDAFTPLDQSVKALIEPLVDDKEECRESRNFSYELSESVPMSSTGGEGAGESGWGKRI